MADLETLRLSITADANAASAGITTLTESLTSLRATLSRFSTSRGLERALGNISTLATGVANAVSSLNIDSGFSRSVTEGLSNIVSAVNSVSDEEIDRIERLGNALRQLPNRQLPQTDGEEHDGGTTTIGERMRALAGNLDGSLTSAGNGAISVIKGVGAAIGGLNNAFNKSSTGLSKFVSSLARIAKYRILRTIIRSITSGAKEGLQNLAHYSDEANAALSNLSTGSLYLKNSFGAALYPAIASVIGIFNSLINVVVRALNILNMFFSILGGKGTYIKATKQTKNYASALGGAGGAAKALKQELMGFDEINALSPSGGGGGGGGGGGLDYGSMFEEVPVESWLKDMIDSGNFSGLGAAIADKINNALGSIPWNKVYAGAKKAADSITSLINGFIAKIDPSVIGQTIAGVINTAALFVSSFWDNTNWEQLGTKTKDAILKAIRGINVKTLANAITGKFRAAIRFLKNLLPTSGAEWKEITDKLTELLNNIILGIKPEDIGDMIASVITGGLKLITSLGEAGTLTNIAKAVVNAIKEAFASISAQDIKDAWDAVKSDVLGALDLLLDLKISIGSFEFSAIGAAITASMLFNVLRGMVGNLLSVTGFTTGARAFSLIAGISMLIDAGVSIAKIIKDDSLSFGDKATEILGEIAKGFLGAGFTLAALGAGTGAAIVLSIGAAIYVTYDIITASANSETLFGDELTQQINDATAAASASAEPIKVVADALTELTGITIPESFILNNLDSMFAGTGLEDGAVEIDGLTDAMNAFIGAVQTATEQGNLDEFLSTLGLLGDTASEAESTVTEATNGVTAAASDLQSKAGEMAESLSEYQAAAEEAGGAADALATDIDELPQVVILDGTALADVESGATAAANSVGGLTAFIAILQRALATLGTGKMFAPISDSADSAKEAVETLKSSISSIPESMNVKISLGNTTSVNSKLSAIKSKIDGIKGKTISIQVKAGLTSGAKAFLNTLKGVSSGSTATSINNLLKLSQFAQGGFPKSGELFMANENGKQELVGRIGNQPAVANQDQIGDAIFRYMDAHSAQSSGGISTDELATAIVRGIKASGLGVVKLDGKIISGSINRETQRSGKPAIQF